MAFNYGSIFGEYGDEKVTGTSKVHPFGTRLVLPDGRIFKYGQMSTAAAIGAGQVCQTAVGVAGHDMDLVITAAGSVGDKSIALTLGAGDAAEDLYAEGYISINDGAGEGHLYKIAGHAAIDGSASGTINLVDGDTIAEAFTTGSLASLHKSPYKDVIIYPTTGTGFCVGVAATEIAALSYGWFQTRGLSMVLCDVAFVVGNHVRASDGTAGSAEPLDRDGTHENEEEIGVAALIAPVTTDYGFVQLTISP
jgi:hypothetical protein